MIRHARKTFLFYNGTLWIKKGSAKGFDIAMGANDGAECCELVGLYLLNKMASGEKPIFSKASCGLYRDDGLSVIKSGSFEANKIKLRIEELFRKEGLKIKVKALIKIMYNKMEI